MTNFAPSLLDYLAFLYGTVGVDPRNLPTSQGAATGGDTTFLEDDDQTWTDNQWTTGGGYFCTDLTLNLSPAIFSNAQAIVNFVTPLDVPVSPGDSYLIAPKVVVNSLNIATATMNETLATVAADEAVYAAYNLAADRLITYAPDVPGQSFWRDTRKAYRITEARVGILSSTSDEGSSMSYLNPEQFKRLTIGDLQMMKTPYGQAYLAFAQAYGEDIWGLS